MSIDRINFFSYTFVSEVKSTFFFLNLKCILHKILPIVSTCFSFASPFSDMSIVDTKRVALKRGGRDSSFDICEENLKLNDFYQFWRLCDYCDPQLPPLLPPLFKSIKFVKYDTWASFCTKNQVYIISRSWDKVISILVQSWKNQRFFATLRWRFCLPFCQFQLKYEIFYFEIPYLCNQRSYEDDFLFW